MPGPKNSEYISGEDARAQHVSSRPGHTVTLSAYSLGLVAAAVVLCAVSFWVGMAYQKHHTKLVATTTASGFAGSIRGFGARRAGGIGTVTAVTSTSITINDQRTSTSKTYTINSSTAITDNGQTVDTSDIKTGDTVFISTDGTGSTVASRILVNPNFGGGFGGPGASGTTSN